MSSWPSIELADLCDPARGITYGIVKVGDFVPGGVPVIRGGDIRNNRIVFDNAKRVTQEVSNQFSRTILQGEELILNLIAEPGHSAIVPTEMAGYNVSRDVAVVPLESSVNHQYVNWYLKSPAAIDWLTARMSGSVTQKINLGVLKNLPIPLPPRHLQDAITDVLGALDDKIAVNERIAATALKLADTHFYRAVQDIEFGDDTFGTVAVVAGGGTPSTKVEDYWNGGIQWATPSDVTALSSPYLFETERTITHLGLENCASQLYPAQSIFMTSRATIGAFALPQVPAAVNQGFIVVIPPDDNLRWWLFHEMRSRVDEMISLANGSTFLELSRKNFKGMQIRLTETADIAAFARTVAPLHAAAAQATNESRTLTTLRDILLPQLMSGRLRVGDAEIVEDAL